MAIRFQSFEDLLSYGARRTPESPALRYEGSCLSYSALLERVRARAEELRATGKSCLGLLSDGSLDCVTELFAANLAGLQLVMLDQTLPVAALRGQGLHYINR